MATFPDEHLWAAYDAAVAAGDAYAVSDAADAIMREHLPFFVQYASQTAFRQWNRETRQDYLAELLAVAFSKIPTYSRTMEHDRGRAQFVTYVKPYLKLVRYKIEGSRGPIRVGHETVRLAADARRFISDEQAEGRPYPTNEQIAEHLRERCRKPVSPERVPRLLALPSSVGLTVSEENVSGSTVLPEAETAVQYEVLEPTDPAEIVAEQDEREREIKRVRDALAFLDLDPLEMAVVTDRLMSETPRSIEAIAADWGVTEMEVKQIDSIVSVKLRRLLS